MRETESQGDREKGGREEERWLNGSKDYSMFD